MADQWQKVSDHAAPPPAPAGWRSTYDQTDDSLGSEVKAQRDANARGGKEAPASQQGFFRSIYETALKPIGEQIHDSYVRGDGGAHAAGEILESFAQQAEAFRANPDVRNIPMIGPAAVQTAQRMQEQYDAGNYTGMIGSAAGFILPFASGEVVHGAKAIPGAIKSAARKVADALPERVPVIPSAVVDTAGIVAPPVAFKARLYNDGANLFNKIREKPAAKTPVRKAPAVDPVSPAHSEILASMQSSIADAETANAANSERVALADDAKWREAQATPAPAAAPEAAPEAPPVEPPVSYRDPNPRLQYFDPYARHTRAPAPAAPESTALVPAPGEWLSVADHAVTPATADNVATPVPTEAPAPAPPVDTAPTPIEAAPAPAPVRYKAGTVSPAQSSILASMQSSIQESKALAAVDAGPPPNALPANDVAQVFDGIEFAPPATPAAAARDAFDASRAPAPAPAPVDTAPTPIEPATPVPAPAVSEPAPASTLEQQLQESVDQIAARKKARGEEVKQANRAAAADRWVKALQMLEQDPPALEDHTNWQRLAVNLGERKGYTPSPDTRELIHERFAAEQTKAADAPLRSRLAEMLTPEDNNGNGPAKQAEQPGPGQSEAGARGSLPEPIRADSPAKRTASGSRTEIDVPGEARVYQGQYEVRDLGELQPSHHGDTFQPNPHYAIENDRNYDDPVNQRKIVDWSVQGPTGFKPRNMLNTAPDSSSGPPVIDSEGNVIGGNGRTMILQRTFKSNRAGAEAYRAELNRTASHFGIDPESYSHMQNPVLVRTIDDAEFTAAGSKQKAVTDFNKVGTAALTPAERAIADSRGVSLRTLDDIAARMDREGPDATLAQVLEGKSGIEVLQQLTRDGVISPQETAALGGDYKLTRAGKERISGLMTGRFFSNARQLDYLPDAIRNKMERIAAPLARVEGNPEYSLVPVTRKALDLLEDVDAHDSPTIDDHIAQQGLFSDKEYSPQAIELAKQLKTRDPNSLTNAVRGYAEDAKYAAEYQGPGMLNEFPDPLKPDQAFEKHFGRKALEEEAKTKAAKKDAAAAAKAAKTPGEELQDKAREDFASRRLKL